MILNRSHIHLDSQKQELPLQGLDLFHITANDGDIHQYPADYIPVHWHPELELFVLTEGVVDIGIGEHSVRLTAGEGCFINTGVLHSFHAPEPGACHYHSFVFDPAIVGGMPGSIFDVAYVRPLLNSGIPFLKFEKDGSDAPFFLHFSAAYTACEEETHGYEFKVRSAFSDLLLYMLKKLPAASPAPAAHAQEKRLKEVLEWISQNLETDISTETLSAASHISPRECQRMFQKYLHISPTEYIRRQRIFLAADLLTTTDEPVTEIGFRCGFSSPSYFSSEFKKVIGKTPTEYRKRQV